MQYSFLQLEGYTQNHPTTYQQSKGKMLRSWVWWFFIPFQFMPCWLSYLTCSGNQAWLTPQQKWQFKDCLIFYESHSPLEFTKNIKILLLVKTIEDRDYMKTAKKIMKMNSKTLFPNGSTNLLFFPKAIKYSLKVFKNAFYIIQTYLVYRCCSINKKKEQ